MRDNHPSLKKNAILNAVRLCTSIAFSLITFPYVSRMLGKAAYGQYSFAQSVVQYFVLAAGLGISDYAVREGAAFRNDPKRIQRFCSELFSINVWSMLLSYVGLVIAYAVSSKLKDYRILLVILSASILLSCIGTEWVNTIYEDFQYITIRYIVIQAIAFVLLLLCIHGPEDVYKYCLIATFASYGGNLVNIGYIHKRLRFGFTWHCRWKQHIKPLLILLANSFATTLYVNSDVTMLGYLYPDATVGIYSFAVQIYAILKQLINAVVLAAVPRLSSYVRDERDAYNATLDKLFQAISLGMLPVCAGVFCLSHSILVLIGGDQYAPGSTTLRILSIATVFAIYSSIVSNGILIVHRLERFCLISTVVTALTNVGLNVLLLPVMGIEGAALTTLIAEVLNCVMQYVFARKHVAFPKIHFPFGRELVLGAASVVLICAVMNAAISSEAWRVILAIVTAVPVYVIILYVFRNPFLLDAAASLQKKIR